MFAILRQAILAILFYFSVAEIAHAQDSVITMQFRGIEGDGYRLRVPEGWRYTQGGPQGPEFYLELSGIELPATYKDGPVIATVFLTPFDAADLDDAVRGTLQGYRGNPDRVFPLEKDEAYEHKLQSGIRAPILKTKFYRKSKELQQIRYDLVTYSEAAKKAYTLTFSIQFADPTYSIEDEWDIEGGVMKLFDTFELK
jgi:hypothetical protein